MSLGQGPSNDVRFVRLFRVFFACVEKKRDIDKLVFCYDFDWFRLYSRDQRQSRLKMFGFLKTQKNALGFIPKYCLKVELCSSKGFCQIKTS